MDSPSHKNAKNNLKTPDAPEQRAVTFQPPGADSVKVLRQSVPEMMKHRRQWCGFMLVAAMRKKKPAKIPVVATHADQKASNKRPSTWRTFEEAIGGLQAAHYTAVAYVLTGDIVGIDLDGDRWVVGDQEPSEEAQGVIDQCSSYCEWSISGRGLHILLKGKLRSGGRRNARAGVEIYTTGRFFIVTGRNLQGTPKEINENQTAIDWLLNRYIDVQNQSGGDSESVQHPEVQSNTTTETTEKARVQQSKTEMTSNLSGFSVAPGDVIRMTQPRDVGERNARIFDLARGLKLNGKLLDAKPAQLKALVARWHRLALPVIGTKGFDETSADFLRGWNTVKIPLGITVEWAWTRAKAEALPHFADGYDTETVRLLVGICWHLAALHPERRFFLSSPIAGRLLGISHDRVLTLLNMLCMDQVIERLERGNQRRATRYRFTDPNDKEES